MAYQKPERVLLTGSAGGIGTVLRRHLGARYRFRCLDRVPTVGEPDAIVADIRDFEAMKQATEGMDAVVHLAAVPGEAPFERLLPNNLEAVYYVYEAARLAGVRRFVFASTNNVSWYWEAERGPAQIHPNWPPRPAGLYACTKVFGEALGRFYSDRYGLSVVCLRIGSFYKNDSPAGRPPRYLTTWVSHRDLAQIVRLSLDTPDLRYEVFYAVSNNDDCPFDMGNARKILGYAPEDNGAAFRSG